MNKMKSNLFFVLILLVSILQQGYAQEEIILRGILKAEANEEPILYGTIQLTGNDDKWAISNNLGKFELGLGKEDLNDTLVIRSIGYQNQLLPLNSIDPTVYQTIYIKDSILLLDEIIVLDLTPKEIVVKALENVEENTYSTPITMDCFYRQSIKEGEFFVKLNEAVLQAYDPSFSEKNGVKVKYSQIRKSYDPRKIKPNPITPPASLFTDYNLVRNREKIQSFIDNDYLTYELEGIVHFNENQLYLISAQAKDTVEQFVLDLKFYLKPKSFKIVRLDFDGGKKLAYSPASMSGGGSLRLSLNEFKGTYLFEEDEDGLMFMQYLQIQVGYEFINKQTDEFIEKYHENSELVVFERQNNITTRPPRRTKNFESMKMDYDQDFWNNFIHSQQIPKDANLLADLNRNTPLESQFSDLSKDKR